MKRFGIQFLTESPEDAEQLIREYMLEAVTRLPELEACESITFAPSPHPETGDRSVVTLAGTGNPEQIISHERDTWNTFIEEGKITTWEQAMEWDEEEMKQKLGEQGAEYTPIGDQLSAEMAKLAIETFDDAGIYPDPVDTFPEEDSIGAPRGWWGILHTLTVQLNYSLDEELDAYTYGIEHTLRNIAEYEGEKEAESRIVELIDEFEGMRNEVKDGRLNT